MTQPKAKELVKKKQKTVRKKAHQREALPPAYASQLARFQESAFWDTVQSAKVEGTEGDSVKVAFLTPSGKHLTGLVKAFEFLGQELPPIGSTLEVFVEKKAGSPEEAEVSFEKAQELKATEALKKIKAENTFVEGFLVAPVKGGYSVALMVKSREEAEAGKGVRGFLPNHDATLLRGEKLSTFQKDQLVFHVKDFDEKTGNLILSRRDILQKERALKADEIWQHLQLGFIVSGTVRSLVSYGAFVDIGGVDGLLHVSDLAWTHVPNAENVLKVGQEITAKVIELDKENRKLKLGIKQLTPDPWEEVKQSMAPGKDVTGTVVALTDFGVFLHIQEGVEGLIHASEISWQRVKHPSQHFQIGSEVKARVLALDKENRRIALSTKALEKSPVEKLADKFPVGAVLKTHVARLLDFGVQVELEEGVLGFVHVSEMSWTKRVEDPSELVSEGQEVEVVVLGYEPERQRVSCSMKQVHPNPWTEWQKTFQKGARVKGQVKKVSNQGAEIELAPELMAFCPFKELSSDAVSRSQDAVKQGQELEVLVTAFDGKTGKVTVSVRALIDKETREAYEQYLEKQAQEGGGTGTTLGEVVKSHQDG